MEKLLTFISQFVKVFSPPLFTKSLDKLIPVMSKCQNVWASYHLTKKVQDVDPVIERFPENVHKKVQGIHTQCISTSSSELHGLYIWTSLLQLDLR